ncbi:hypothetical protein ACOMHN_023549 [Nucella lapillus]
MASNDQSLAASDPERRLPLRAKTAEDEELELASSCTASSEAGGETGLVFVRRSESEGAEPPTPHRSTGAGRVTLSSPPNPRLEGLWKGAEGVMGARRSRVREVMEEFGVADVAPASDQLEEELWRVVEGESTLQEAADLV